MASTQTQRYDFIVRWRQSVTEYLAGRSVTEAQVDRYTSQDLANEITQADLDIVTGAPPPGGGPNVDGIDLVTFQNSVNVMTTKNTLDAGEQTVLFTVSN